MLTGTMRRSVKLVGTSLTLEGGQHVKLVEATNLPDVGYKRYYASPGDGHWADGLDHNPEDSILLDPDDVWPDNQFQRIAVPVAVVHNNVLDRDGHIVIAAATNLLACALAGLINRQTWHDGEVWLNSDLA